MTNESCPILSPEQRQFLEIREAAEKVMLETIEQAISDAAAEVANKIRSAGLEFEPTDRDYFAFTAQQSLFVRLCGGDPHTFEGGDPEIGDRILRNGRHIIDHYWKARGTPSP
ncbi:hypothetical protein HGP17_24405 [Rhizobium sp. P38BS-XIX]|nr:hypothetical protein [Rhizobium sp. P38BS-XIX]NLR99978.1 hypothetical protein [Rhizobium sp. P38BS-XIX]